MWRLFSLIVTLALPILIVANMLVFVSGIHLGDQIGYFEKETQKIHEKNIELVKESSHYDSLQYAASMAATLNFTNTSNPVILDNLKYALNR